ncbi:MAG: hypothetical protein WA966_02640 [Ornithinimicrobium sp.]
MPLLTCEYTLVPDPHEPLNGTLRVRVVDDTRADDTAATLSTLVEAGLQWAAGSPILRTLESAGNGPPNGSALQAHFDLDGSGEVAVGDYVTMQRYALPAGGAGNSPLMIELRLVR